MKKILYILTFSMILNSFPIPTLAHENEFIFDKSIIPTYEERKNFYIDKGELSVYVAKLYEVLTQSEIPNTLPELEYQFYDINVEEQSHIPKLVALGIMNGTTQNQFSPEATTTVEEFCSILVNTIRASYPDIYIDTKNDTAYNFILSRGIIDKNIDKKSNITLKNTIDIIDNTIKSAPEFNIINIKNDTTKKDNNKNKTNKNKNTNKNQEVMQTKTAYLTFDDSVSSNTEDILDILKEYDIKATFYVTGEADPKILKRMVNEGHAIGNHTYSHDYKYIYSSVDNFFKDFYKEEKYLESIIGYKPKLVRLPGGSNNTVSKKYGNSNIMKQITSELEKRGYIYTDWNSEAKDATTKNITAKQVKDNIFKTVEPNKNSIVLMHQTKGKETTVEALPSVIEEFKNRGFKFDVISKNSYNTQFS